MHIYWDIEIQHPQQFENLSPEARGILDTTKNFIIQRFEPLENEMEKEWVSNKAFVGLHILVENNTTCKISYFKFSESLIRKLECSLSPSDFEYMNTILLKA